MSFKRLSREYRELQSMQPDDIFKLKPENEDNLNIWTAELHGAENTVYYGKSYELRISVPTEYPFKAPTARIITPILHPNVNKDGEMCLAIFKSDWSPDKKLLNIVQAMQSMLVSPNWNERIVMEPSDPKAFMKLASTI